MAAINALNQGSTTLRNIPDLAAEANTDNYFCANGSCQGGVGGTSLSAPRWAGFVALADQQANGTGAGLVNPTIYALGQKPSYKLGFHDITTGDNFNGESPTMFSAVVNYDLVTGFGSPTGQQLLNILGPPAQGPNFKLSASPATLTLTQGTSGTSTITLTPVNGFSGTVTLAATVLGSPTGVTATLNPATLSGSGASTLTVTTTGSTPGGNFPIAVTGTSGGLTQAAYVTLALPGFSIIAPGSAFVNQGASSVSSITVVPVNGFKGRVSLSVAGAPSGVTATIVNQGSYTYQLDLTATGLAKTGFASLTITGASGNLTQTATVSLAVSGATGENGSGTIADLSAAFNITGIYTDGTVFTTGGLDGGGYAYSANLLTTSRTVYGVPFLFGPANSPDAISGAGQTVALPAGKFSKLVMLGTGVQGSQESQPLTVTYTDGTMAQFTQSFSDWYQPQNFPGEFEGVAMAYRDVANGTQDNRTFNLYGYTLALNNAKTVAGITLPTNQYVLVLAITLEK